MTQPPTPDGAIKILVPTGSLGAGAREEEVAFGIADDHDRVRPLPWQVGRAHRRPRGSPRRHHHARWGDDGCGTRLGHGDS